jgi:hypothetical protein
LEQSFEMETEVVTIDFDEIPPPQPICQSGRTSAPRRGFVAAAAGAKWWVDRAQVDRQVGEIDFDELLVPEN